MEDDNLNEQGYVLAAYYGASIDDPAGLGKPRVAEYGWKVGRGTDG